ncbi:MAG: class II glutamine amidotransferase [Bacteroidetes bacterium]|nr:class II glutamine amidotransferase [Bacteroidota bacterium]
MCRLYGFRSTTARKVECELIRAQNSLIAQSHLDERGESNPDGWGLGAYSDGEPCVDRQAAAAYESEAFRWAAARVHSCQVMAHVRRATIGNPGIQNTHPFEYGRWLLAHNGSVGAFPVIRPRMLEAMTLPHRQAIQGETDSEHVFHLLLSLHEQQPEMPLLEVLRHGLQQVIDWSRGADPDSEIALNILWSNGEELVGARLGRSLWFVAREAVHPCEVCPGALHATKDSKIAYRAVVVASEPLTTTEDWTAVPENSVFRIGSNAGLHIEAYSESRNAAQSPL